MAPKTKKAYAGKGKERPPPIDKLLLPAIGIGLALLLFQFFKGINSEVVRVNVEDDLELRELFFGEVQGKNYAVLCHDGENTKIPVSSVFQDANNDGSAPAEFRVLDCNHMLKDSEKTVAERFKLNLKTRPTIFVSGRSGPPKQVPAKMLKTGKMLVKALKNLLEPKAEKIETTQDLRTRCLDKDMCGLLLKGSKTSPNYVKDAMLKLIAEHPKISFAAVDTSVLYVKNLEEYLPELENQQPRFVMFQKVSGSVDTKAERLKTSIAALPTNGVSYGQMSNLVASVVTGSEPMTKLSTLPTIKTRSKKLVSEELAKRARKIEQQRRAANGEDPSSSGGEGGGASGHFTGEANDGSKEGRKMERDKRRQDHKKNNPNYREKTPEEKAEMERQRRKRMEEESAKWNMAPEDMPEEGSPMGDDDGEEYMDDNQSQQGQEGEDDNDEDDDEEVLDLD